MELKKRVDELLTLKVKTIAEGKELVEEINQAGKQILENMRAEDITNELHRAYSDLHYDFIKARKNIQSQMVKLVRNK